MEEELVSIEMLYKKLENTLSDTERERVEKWLKSKGHREYFDQIKQFYRLCDKEKISESELKEAWRILRKRIEKKSSDSHKWIIRGVVVAASLMIGWGIWFLFLRESGLNVVKNDMVRILPGRVQATLELADGQTYHLKDDEVPNKEIAQHIVLDSGCLAYILPAHENPEQLIYNKLIIPRGGEFQIKLEDGTKIWLNADSQLKYPQVFSATVREVWLEGEAYFEVAKDRQRPFIVHSGVQKTTVLGTSFGVTNYPGEHGISTTLVNGKVHVEYSGITDQVYVLQPGERIQCLTGSKSIHQEKVDVYEYVAWKEGRYVFSRRRLEDMLNTLARWYDFEIFFLNQAAKEIVFSGELKRFENFNRVLEMIEKSSEIQFVVNGRAVMVK